MYSGTTLNQKSGNMLGVHQRIDRLARKRLKAELNHKFFPTIAQVLHFEGKNGPDGIKRKMPSTDELWHFIDPNNPEDKALIGIIHDHHVNLVAALQKKDEQRAAFEAAWLAHAVVDGLTPAHHYPLEDKLEELRGESMHTRTTLRKKVLLPGNSRRQILRNNWEFWGAKGVMTSHYLFEFGVAGAMTPIRNGKNIQLADDIQKLKRSGFEQVFQDNVAAIHGLDMYETFCRTGWTTKLASQTRRKLIPIIVSTVILAWLDAIYAADL
jgi:hypothetical protein